MDDPLEAQQWLLESSLPLVFEAVDDAKSRSVRRPVVLLLDCEDSIGGEIARALLGNAQVNEAIAERRLDDADQSDTDRDDADEAGSRTTVFAQALGWNEARRIVPQAFPYLREAFEMADDGPGFLAISVTAGGASALTVPWSARELQ